MILHMLKEDFRSNAFFCALIGVLTAIYLYHPNLPDFFREALMYSYGLLLMTVINGMVGSSWRMQYLISRNFLLALPISRNFYFFGIYLRSFVFAMPLLISLLFMPYESRKLDDMIHNDIISWIEYSLFAILWIIQLINFFVSGPILTERYFILKNQAHRIFSWILLFALFVLEIIILAYAFFEIPEKYGSIIALMLTLIVVAQKTWRTHRLWLGRPISVFDFKLHAS